MTRPQRLLHIACTLIIMNAGLAAQKAFDTPALTTFLPQHNYTSSTLQLVDLAYIPDQESTLTLDQALQRFARGEFSRQTFNETENFGSGFSTHWFAAALTNRSGGGEPLCLYFENTNPDSVEVWIIQGDQIAYRQSGHQIPPGERDLLINNSAVRLDLEPGKATILVWRVKNNGPTIFSMFIIKISDLFLRLQGHAMALMTLIGGLISLMIFSIFLFNAVRDKTHLFFIAQLAGFCIYLFCLHGYGNIYFWHTSQSFDKLVNDIALLGALMASMQLLRLFLDTRSKDRLFHHLLGFLALSMPVLFVLLLFQYQVAIGALLVSIALLFLASHIAIIRAMLRGERGMAVALAAWAILASGGGITAAINSGIQLPGPSMAILLRAEHWGIFIGSILFMFALTQRIQHLRRDKEDAEHKNQLKQDFIANISHEMRTPLNGIIGFAESVAHSEHLGEIQFYNRNIISESERLLFQINQLLDLAKIEAGRLELEIRPFSLPQSLAYLQSAYSMKANAKGLDFNLSMDSACPLALRGDRLRLEQVLRNLIDNAIKFTDSGTIGVAVRVYRQDLKQAVLVFDISDTGIGIEPGKLDLIMEDFVQADSSITRRFGGTGLGTSIARRLVEAMDGHIEVKSSQGMGTNFRVFLPFGIAPGIPDAAPIQIPAIAEPPVILADPGLHQAPIENTGKQKLRILIVDDLDTNRQVLRIHLRKLDLHIEEAENAEQALSMLSRDKYDLILMDVFMPGMSGHEATRAIRIMPGNEKLPVIAVTASGFQQDLDAAHEAGMNEVLIKPIKRDHLLELISRYLAP